MSCNEHKHDAVVDAAGGSESEEVVSKGVSGDTAHSHSDEAAEAHASPSDAVLPWTTRLIPGKDGWKVDCEVKESSIPGAGHGTYVKERCPSGTVRCILN